MENKLIIVVINGHEFTAKHRAPLIRYLSLLGYRVKCLVPKDSEAEAFLKKRNYTTIPWNVSRSGKNILKETIQIFKLISLYRIHSPKFLIHATIKPVIYGTIASMFTKAKVCNLITGLGSVYIQKNLRNKILRFLVSTIYQTLFTFIDQTIIFQNIYDKKALLNNRNYKKVNSFVIAGSGIESTDTFYNSISKNPNVTFIGRLIKEKGIHVLLEIAKKVKKLRPDVKFNLVGPIDPDNPSSVSENEINTLQDSNLINWVGKVENIEKIYLDSRLIILPSHREGLPKVLLEAGNYCKVALASDVPGCKDVIINNKTGFLFPIHDVEGFSEKIIDIIDNKELLVKMGQAAKKHIDKIFQQQP